MCGCKNGEKSPQAENKRKDISAAELKKLLAEGEPLTLLDVRTRQEYAAGHIKGAINKPVEEPSKWAKDYGKADRLVLVCRSGRRSKDGADALVAQGFRDVSNVLGGVNAWSGELVK